MPKITSARQLRGFPVVAVVLALSACVAVQAPNPAPKADLHEAAEINTRLGLGYMQEGNLKTAQEKLSNALEQDPEYAGAHAAIAMLYARRGDYDEAEKQYRQALSLDRDNPDLKNTVGAFLCDRSKNEEGLRYLLEAAQDHSYTTPEMAWANAGICTFSAKRPDDAENYFREALKVNPNYPTALAQMARVNFERKDYLHARAFLQRYQRVGPPTPDTLWLGASVERQLGNPRDAHDYEIKLIQKFPNSDQSRQIMNRTSP
jgi:type IV pilus assembly protein PilF